MIKTNIILLIILFITGLNSKAQTTIYGENFNNTWTSCNAPDGWSSSDACGGTDAWHRNDVTTGWASTGGSPIATGSDGDKYARFHSYDISYGNYSTLITGAINLSSYTSTTCTLTFYYINPSGSDNLVVAFSKDGGTTWSTAQGTYSTNTAWTKKTITIGSTYLVSNFKIRFYATSDYGANDIGLDQVAITCPNVSPTKLSVTSINGGANPTIIKPFNIIVNATNAIGVNGNVTLNTTYSLTLATGTGNLQGTLNGTIAAGTNGDTLTGLIYNKVETGVSVTATVSSGDALTAGTSLAFNVLDSANHLTFAGAPTTAYPNVAITQFTVEARKADNTVDANYTGNITLSLVNISGIISGTLTKAAVAGVATFNDIIFTTDGNYTITANSGSLTSTVNNDIQIKATLFYEDFNDTWISCNAPDTWTSEDVCGGTDVWHRNDITTGWSSATSGKPSTVGSDGSYYARYHSYSISSGNSLSVITPAINLSSCTSCNVSFYYINPSGSDNLKIYFSNNGGSTWSAPMGTYTTASSWTQQTISIGATYQVSNFKIKFTATSDYGDDDIGLDQVIVTCAPSIPTKLSVAAINNGINPNFNTPFTILVKSTDVNGNSANVTTATSFTLNLATGTGTLSGTLTGTIIAGTNTATVSGLTYNKAETGVSITATRTSGDALTAGTSTLFNVLDTANHVTFVSVPATCLEGEKLASFTVEARRPDNSVDANFAGSITIAKVSGSGNISGTLTKTAVAGVATFDDVALSVNGNYTISATSGTLTPDLSTVIQIQNTIFSENFYSTWTSCNIPNEWTSTDACGSNIAWHRNDITSNWSSPTLGSPADSGSDDSYYARFHTYGITSGSYSEMISKAINLSYYTNVNLSFYTINPSGTDNVKVYFSNDGGSTWSAALGTYTATSDWTKQTISVGATYLVSNFKVKFRGTSDKGTDDIGIDQVIISCPPLIPTKLGIPTINNGNSPTVNRPFDIIIQSQDANGIARNVIENTIFTVSIATGTGEIQSTITDTILAGAHSKTISNVIYNKAENGVSLTATRTTGDVLSAGTSATFTVLDTASHFVFFDVPSSTFTNSILTPFTIEAKDASDITDINFNGNITVSKTNGFGNIIGTLTKTAVNGIATFDDIQFNAAGIFTITATSSVLTGISSNISIVNAACIGDSIKLELATFIGNIQWQQSEDSIVWEDITGATYQPYKLKIEKTLFFRARVIDETCDPVYSDLQKIVIAPPTITVQPTDQTTCPGNFANFSLTATGTDITYQWQISTNSGTTFTDIKAAGTGPVYSNWTTKILTASNNSMLNTGLKFRCYISGKCIPAIYSDTVTLTVDSIVSITPSTPASKTICENSTHSFSVTAAGTGLAYQWQVLTNGGTTYNNIVTGGSNPVYSNWNTKTLSLSGITTLNNNSKYRCIVSSLCSAPLTSNVATLTVITIPTGVSAKVSGDIYQICDNSTLSLIGGGTNVDSWKWTYPNGNTSSLKSPSISSVTTNNAGVYFLTASNDCGTAPMANTAPIIVNTAPALNVATDVDHTAFTANWGFTTNASTYYVDVSTSNTFSSLVYTDISTSGSSKIFNDKNTLLVNQTYYYRVSTEDCPNLYNSYISVATPAFYIGEDYQGGVIFHVNPDNQGGLIVANQDLSEKYPWGCEGTLITGADGTAIGTGQNNTTNIKNGCNISNSAAKLCDLYTTPGVPSYSDWYLPSSLEVDKFLFNYIKLGIPYDSRTGCPYYWSSTQSDLNQAYLVGGLKTCTTKPIACFFAKKATSKDSFLLVRPIRDFHKSE